VAKCDPPFAQIVWMFAATFTCPARYVNRGSHALSGSTVHRGNQRTGGMIRVGNCADRGDECLPEREK
jgi:hypothetical protein